jgi:hypothetical protein
MTENKQLSPEAQAVLNAFTEDNALHNWSQNRYKTTALAAALRELVFQLQYYNCLEGEDMLLDARAILDVADELEGKK